MLLHGRHVAAALGLAASACQGLGVYPLIPIFETLNPQLARCHGLGRIAACSSRSVQQSQLQDVGGLGFGTLLSGRVVLAKSVAE